MGRRARRSELPLSLHMHTNSVVFNGKLHDYIAVLRHSSVD
jgi:hypothetical protein